MQSFLNLGLDEDLLKAVQQMGFETPSEIQSKAIPQLLEKETDLVALAQTGTGKTAAFGFPLLQKIDTKRKVVQGLIIAPTRELCLQITTELGKYAQFKKGTRIVAVYGGASVREQAESIKSGVQIVVATPGRLLDLIQRKMLRIDQIEYCVLDEADEMLNMGFYQDIKSILSYTPEDKLTWLFSATMPAEVAQIAKEFMHRPVEITVGSKNEGATSVSHFVYTVSARNKYAALKRIVDSDPQLFAVIFCRTKRETQKIAEKLIEDGYNAGALHGDLSQNQRDLVMAGFRKRQIQILVATDVAARGIDVDDITHVIHYQLPDEPETYNHRSGRTGRAGKTGHSLCLCTNSDRRKIEQFERKLKKKFNFAEVPSVAGIIENQLKSLADKLKDTEVDESIESYMPLLEETLASIDRDTLLRKVFGEAYNRLAQYYLKENFSSENTSESSSRAKHGEVRFFINLGERDGFNWKSMKDYLKDALELQREDIFKVDTLNNFSFFNVDAGLTDLVLEAFKDTEHNGYRVSVEVTKQGGGSGDKGKSKKGNFKTKPSRNFSKNSKKTTGKRKRKGFY
ncbi:MAG: DEAD-box ATP-dependent RNA helicase CshA [Flavobacteriaceae bacterium]|jgi:ATP-dependent RNA helicase DeaD|nr:MAG: DEAD-box ATP-dependent RNA helicase CshA [Flavobacteriaceae bacterium]